MGILLKQALKGICNSNQWSYAVFWKIGHQNPELLIWEECYYEALPSSSSAGHGSARCPLGGWESRRLSDEKGPTRLGDESEDKLCLLINRMMLNNQINVVGEGIAGRAAFSADHLWILLRSYNRNTHPQEVLNELHLQFSSGMQTVAVIPVFPHGVVQLGSSLAIMENMRFINDVKNLILDLGSIPGALLPENYATKDLEKEFHGHVAHKIPNPSAEVLKSFMGVNGCNQQGHSSQVSELIGHNQNGVSSKFDYLDLPISSHNYCDSKVTPANQPNLMVHEEWFNLPPSFNSQANILPGSGQSILLGSGLECHGNNNPSATNSVNLSQLRISGGRVLEEKKERSELYDRNSHLNTPRPGGIKMQNSNLAKMEFSLSSMVNRLSNVDRSRTDNVSFESLNGELIQLHEGKHASENTKAFLLEQDKHESRNRNSGLQEFNTSGDDLFDVLGVELKNKLLNENFLSPKILGGDNSLVYDMYDCGGLCDDIPSSRDHITGSDGFSYSDDLLDAVVSGGCFSTKQSSEDNASEKTTLTKISSSSLSWASMPDQLQRERLDLPKPLFSSGTLDSRSSKSGSGKNDLGNCSQSNSVYGSQISSWVEQGNNSVKEDNSESTAYSKRPNEANKLNRKRLKPGETPRPRPKDRQMFQDRLKELREIVPNGAKCSIDALLERTIKHMLFLQSVTKHADKLKHTEEPRIISKEGGLLLKDNLEGGATWAFEVGSKSMVCPIIVKDLNPPRQMLVEMLCEDRGFFLEIADLIRGLGLTILKGVMESRSDKIWARFAVEANRDVTRMEIFMSLVHLLEQTMKGGGGCLSDAIDIGHLMVHNSFPQTAPIPATGRSNDLP